jgi:hypothetical protein
MAKLVYISFLLSLLTSLLLGGGCSGFSPNKAEVITNNYFQFVKDKDYNSTFTYYSPILFKDITQQDWIQALKNMDLLWGDLQTWKLKTWSVEKKIGIGGSGTYYVLQYEVTYDKYNAIETFTLFTPSSTDDIKILGLTIK